MTTEEAERHRSGPDDDGLRATEMSRLMGA